MKQSAVEWLYEKIKSNIDAEDGSMNMNWLYDDTFQQAKEMEKEQSDNLAIGFGACLIELLNDSETKAETMKELLQIFKEQRR
jgi:hypothetical protein